MSAPRPLTHPRRCAVLAALLLGLGALLGAGSARAKSLALSRPQPLEQFFGHRAKDLLEEAREDRNAGLIGQAARKYRVALPLSRSLESIIRYELALVLIELGQPVEAAVHLEAVIERGTEGLHGERTKLAHARQQLQELREHKLATVVVTCPIEGAVIFIDNQQVFVVRRGRPRTYVGQIRAGKHMFVAELPGEQGGVHLLREIGPAGTTVRIELAPQRVHKRRWSGMAWAPWTMFGGGALIGVAGRTLQTRAQASYDEYERGSRDCMTGSCDGDRIRSLETLRDDGDTRRRLGIAAYAIAGAAIATAGVLAYLNRPVAHRSKHGRRGIDPKQPHEQKDVSISPLAGSGVGGVMVMGRF